MPYITRYVDAAIPIDRYTINARIYDTVIRSAWVTVAGNNFAFKIARPAAADKDIVTIDIPWELVIAVSNDVGLPYYQLIYDVLFSHNTPRLLHSKMLNNPSRSSEIDDFVSSERAHAINTSNLSHMSRRSIRYGKLSVKAHFPVPGY